jgi:hypothetical protein
VLNCVQHRATGGRNQRVGACKHYQSFMHWKWRRNVRASISLARGCRPKRIP